LLVNVIERGYQQLLAPLTFYEAAPPLFLWMEHWIALHVSDDQTYPLLAWVLASEGKFQATTEANSVNGSDCDKGRCVNDIQDGVDCRKMPYKDGELDCVVFDPPYMHTPGGTAHTTSHVPFEKHYRNNWSGNQTASKYHEAVLDLYREGGREAYRTLKGKGVFIVKCQDEVCANRQRFTHVEIMHMYEEIGFIAEDLFVVVRNNRPGVSRMVHQVHARKNHSYFLVFWKQNGGNGRWEPPK